MFRNHFDHGKAKYFLSLGQVCAQVVCCGSDGVGKKVLNCADDVNILKNSLFVHGYGPGHGLSEGYGS